MAKKRTRTREPAKSSKKDSKRVKTDSKRKSRSNRRVGAASGARAGLPASAAFLEATHTAVRKDLKASLTLSDALASLGGLSREDRILLVKQALLLFEQNYVHLPLKRAMHAVDPVQRLRLLLHRLEQTPEAELPSEIDFHLEMIDIFKSVRDLHTNYLLPAPFDKMEAFLPFNVEEYFDEDGQRRYVVSHVAPGFEHATFTAGVELIRWNGTPIDRAVSLLADRYAGSNLAARHARGLERLTFRPLRISPPPDEEWVLVDYRKEDGSEHQLRFDWLVFPLPDEASLPDPDRASIAAAAQAIDLEMELIQQAKKLVLAPRVVEAEKKLSRRKSPLKGLSSNMPSKLEAREVETSHGAFGYIRIWSFSVNDPDAFVEEFIRLMELLPQDGLILDVRGNGGGHIFASEFLLQTLTPRQIQPEPVQFVNTPLNLRLARRHKANTVGIDLSPWETSMGQSVETGAVYSQGFPITPVEGANAIGQRYFGPVVLIVDARCYSATDIFAAGFQDHEIGRVLGVDANTGAGGANVWTHGLLQDLFRLPTPEPDSPYKPLPGGANLRVSIRRCLRVGRRSGTPLEDLGVVPDEPYAMTRRDVLEGNVELIERAAEILAKQPARRLEVSIEQQNGQITAEISTSGIPRLDIYLKGRPWESLDVTDTATKVVLPPFAGTGDLLELRGYENEELVAVRRVEI